MSQFEFLPIPQSRDFDAAFTTVDEIYRRQGGPTTVAHGESSVSIADEEAMRRDMALASYSTLFIPYESDQTDPHVYDPAHAFSRGFSMAYPVNDILYENRYGFDEYYSSLNGWMVAQGTENIPDDRAWFEVNALLVQKYGEGGLELLGEQAASIVEDWSDRLYTNPSLARVFTMGCGALAMSGVIHQRSINEYTVKTAGFAAGLDRDLEALLMGDGNANNA